MIDRLDGVKKGVKAADELRIVMPTLAKPVYTIYAPVTDSLGVENYATFLYHPQSDRIIETSSGATSTVGETLYRLHYLDQVPLYIGRYIAGFVSLFFAFAIITGLLIHWKNIRSKLFAFSFKQVKKQFWTNSHTVFAILGLPFQLMYAVTGAFYMLSVFVLAPAVMLSYKGDQQKLITTIYPSEAFHVHNEHGKASHMPFTAAVAQIRKDYPDNEISYLEFINPGKAKAALGADLIAEKGFNGNGTVVLDLETGNYKLKINPGDRNYAQSLLAGIAKLHFGSFGGWLMKFVYFILSMLTCFVIISGVLIWKEARNKPSYTDQQRKFHHRVTMIYLAVCFALFPASALLFLLEHLVPMGIGHADLVNT
ncbi:MAG: PepSY domain-containing protein, partial [Chitinophagaceae bacterium]